MKIKEVIVVSMLFLIISHGVIQFAVFKLLQAKYRSEIIEMMLSDLSKSELVTLKFKKSSLDSGVIKINWYEDDEFRFENKMYDVIKKVITGDSVFLYCIHDENESKLYAYFDKYFKLLMERDHEKGEDLISFSSNISVFYSKPLDIKYESNNYTNKNYRTIISSVLLEGEHFSVIHPPRV